MSKRLPLLGLAATIVIAAVCYSAALGADYQFDDEANLVKLATVTDFDSAVEYVFSGTAGPTGRPLALLSFALQASQWQQGPDAFLRVNIAIHLLNALLLAFVVRQLFLIRGDGREQAMLIGCVAASIWVTLPLIATATVFVVQRMATLSSLFMLLGFAGYLASRTLIERTPRKALLLMSTSLAAATVLATLAKEIGLLLPAYVLVVECTLLSRPASVSAALWRGWSAVFLWLPALVVIAYLLSLFNYPDYVIQYRGFNAVERLLTEAQLLWVYLSKALLGLAGRLGVYHGDVAVVRSLWSPVPLLAVASWIALAIISVVWRRRYPLLAFAVLWYLAGHSLESTTVAIELYFEHRNYLPIAGPIIALTAFLILHSDRVRKVSLKVIPLVVLVNAVFLYSFTSLHGNPRVAAGFWAIKYPDSLRAVTNLVDHQARAGNTDQAVETIRGFVRRNPEYATLRLEELNLVCMTRPGELQPVTVDEVQAQLADSSLQFVALESLMELFVTASEGQCPAVSTGTVMQLAEALRNNPRYAGHPRYNMVHHLLLATMEQRLGDINAAVGHLQTAYDSVASEDVVRVMTLVLATSGRLADARAFLDRAAGDEPGNPIMVLRWRRLLGQLDEAVYSIEMHSREGR